MFISRFTAQLVRRWHLVYWSAIIVHRPQESSQVVPAPGRHGNWESHQQGDWLANNGHTCFSLADNGFSVASLALWAAPLYCTVLYCTVLYCTVLYCIVLYCTVPAVHAAIYIHSLMLHKCFVCVWGGGATHSVTSAFMAPGPQLLAWSTSVSAGAAEDRKGTAAEDRKGTASEAQWGCGEGNTRCCVSYCNVDCWLLCWR